MFMRLRSRYLVVVILSSYYGIRYGPKLLRVKERAGLGSVVRCFSRGTICEDRGQWSAGWWSVGRAELRDASV